MVDCVCYCKKRILKRSNLLIIITNEKTGYAKKALKNAVKGRKKRLVHRGTKYNEQEEKEAETE